MSERCECGHEREDHNVDEGCEGHIDMDPTWCCRCDTFVPVAAEATR